MPLARRDDDEYWEYSEEEERSQRRRGPRNYVPDFRDRTLAVCSPVAVWLLGSTVPSGGTHSRFGTRFFRAEGNACGDVVPFCFNFEVC